MSRDRLLQTDALKESAPPRAADDETRPRVGVWGRFDAVGFVDLVQPWILDREIRRRVPGVELTIYAPLERGRRLGVDPGFAAADLGEWGQTRSAELGESLDCVVVTGDLFGASDEPGSAPIEEEGGPRLSPFLVEGLGSRLDEEECPFAWSAVGVAYDLEPEEADRLRKSLASRAYVSVRDEASRLRLRRAGVDREIALVPDPLVLLPRAFPDELRNRRLEYLRHMGWFPRSGAPLIVQESAVLRERAEELVASLTTALERSPLPVVLVDLGPPPADTRLMEAVSRQLPVPTFRIPSDAGVSDVVAALSHARAFVGMSARAAVACSSFGVPAVILDRALESTPRKLVLAIRETLRAPAGAGPTPADVAALDAHFDRLAGLAESALARRLRRRGSSRETFLARLRENDRVLKSWREAYSARTEQVLDLRLRSVDLAEAEAKLTAEVKTLTDENARRHHAWAAATFDLATEKAAREAASTELSKERDLSAQATAERDVLSREAVELRAEKARLQTDLAEAERREKRGTEEILSLQTEIARVRERLEKARADYSNLHASQALLFTEIAETRADAGRSAERVDELQAELDRLRDLLPPDSE
jgi:hypothetical protein